MNKVIKIIILLILVVIDTNYSQNSFVKSGVYNWSSQNSNQTNKIILEGETTDFENLKISAESIDPGANYIVGENELEDETMVIFKNGNAKLSFGDKEKILIPGSIAIIYPNEEYKIENIGDDIVEYYLFQYRSKSSTNISRGKEEGGSFYVDWNELEFSPHDKGGVRQYCERATEMLRYFSMHVTTLNPGIKSHEPHIHKSDEMVIMISGKTEMQIGDEHFYGNNGDVYFLGADVPHAIGNLGESSCMYYAFHWE